MSHPLVGPPSRRAPSPLETIEDQLENKTLFVVLLLLGIFNLGILGMIAYVIAGPDGTTTATPQRVHAPAGA